jgi:hypothetical protein
MVNYTGTVHAPPTRAGAVAQALSAPVGGGRRAPGGRSIDEFVVNALDAFHEETIEKIERSAVTAAHGGFPKKLIQLGCMKFVTRSSTRAMVQRANGRTGRLPDWIIEQLENSHLLRSEQRGGQVWYELSHDRLAEPVGQELDREVSSLLFASDMLSKVLENVLHSHGGTLGGYFKEHRDVLVECQPFHSQTGLFEDEAEFVFRASLTAGQDMSEWSARLAADFPAIRSRVVREAVTTASATVRRNVATMLGRTPLDDMSKDLVKLAVDDRDADVRRAAAESLALLDEPTLFEQLNEAVREPAKRADALHALARIRNAVDASTRPSSFESCLETLSSGERRAVRSQARRLRFSDGFAMFPFLVLPAAGIAAVAAAAFKWLPGKFNWAVGQTTGSAMMGIFQGVVAGVLWAGMIVLGLTVYHVVFGRRRGPRSAFRPLGAVFAGAMSGLIGSSLLVLTLIGVFDSRSLASIGWLTSGDVVPFTPAFFRDIFATTRFGWVYLVTGTGLGVGMALATNALRRSPAWLALLDENGTGMSNTREAAALLARVTRVAAPFAWWLPLTVGGASIAAFFIPNVSPEPAVVDCLLAESKATATCLLRGLIGDGLTQVIGAYFAICGMMLGMLVMRRGLQIEPRLGET